MTERARGQEPMLEQMRRVVAAYVEAIGDGQYLVRPCTVPPGLIAGQEICLGLEVIAKFYYGSDGYLVIEVINEMMRALNHTTLGQERYYRLPLVHPDLFELLLAFLSP